LTDPHGKVTDFTHTIIIMTTNSGAREAQKGSIGINPTMSHKITDEAIKREFSPEFINRLDKVVHFSGLNEVVSRRVLDKFLLELEEQLKGKKITVEFTESLRKWLLEKGFEPAYGARPMARVLRENITLPLSDKILFGDLKNGGHVKIGFKNKAVDLQTEPQKPKKNKKKSKKKSDPVV